MIAELIGAPVEMAPQLLEWSHRMVAMYQFGVTREVEDAAASAAEDFAQFLREHIARRRGDPRDDLISRLIEAESDGARLSESELVTTCILLLNAGHEATVHSIGNGLKAILEGGAAFAEVRIDDAMVEELLRFDAPLHLFTRYALQDIEIAGIELHQGDQIGLLLGAANRDPLAFAEPGRFDPRRAPNPHVAFGAGIHFCVGGAFLARLEMRIGAGDPAAAPAALAVDPERRATATPTIFMGWKRSGRVGDAQGVSPFSDEPNCRLYFSGLIVFNELAEPGKFSSSIFRRTRSAGVAECAGRFRRVWHGASEATAAIASASSR